jgi:hypothetical protein
MQIFSGIKLCAAPTSLPDHRENAMRKVISLCSSATGGSYTFSTIEACNHMYRERKINGHLAGRVNPTIQEYIWFILFYSIAIKYPFPCKAIHYITFDHKKRKKRKELIWIVGFTDLGRLSWFRGQCCLKIVQIWFGSGGNAERPGQESEDHGSSITEKGNEALGENQKIMEAP